MQYFKVKEEYDQYSKTKLPILVKNELLTKKEMEKYNVPEKAVEPIIVSQKRIFWIYGVRFAIDNTYTKKGE